MNYVDQRIEEAVNATEHFFGKDTTAYIFTADHGMTIKSSGFRQDVEQASITPLIASLIGISIPINNEVSIYVTLSPQN